MKFVILLNLFFAKVGHDINATFEDCNDSDFLQYVEHVEETAFFKPITSKEIIEIVNTLRIIQALDMMTLILELLKELYI